MGIYSTEVTGTHDIQILTDQSWAWKLHFSGQNLVYCS